MKTGPSQRKWYDKMFGFFEHPTLPTGHFYSKPDKSYGFRFYHRLNKRVCIGRYEEYLVYQSMWTSRWRKSIDVYRLYKRVIDGGQVVTESLVKEGHFCVAQQIRKFERQGYKTIDRFDVVV